METLTSTTQAEATYNQAALDIMELFDLKGFTSEHSVDHSELQADIVNRIRQRIEGNVNYAIEPDITQRELNDIIKDLENTECCSGCCDCDTE